MRYNFFTMFGLSMMAVSFSLLPSGNTLGQDSATKSAVQSKAVADRKTVVIENFNRGAAGRNELNGDTGSFHAPRQAQGNDLVQSYEFISDSEWALRLDYDLTGKAKSGMVGYWTRLNRADFTQYAQTGYLTFSIRGDQKRSFPSRIKIDLKRGEGARQDVVSYALGGITETWNKRRIPLLSFKGLASWDNMFELVFVLAVSDLEATDSLKGTLYIDNITVEEK